MIKIKIDGTTYVFDKEEVESKITESGISKLKDNDFGGKRGMFGSLIGSALTMIGIKKPKEVSGMDNLEFASRLALTMILNQLDGQTIELTSNGVEEDEK